jgi:hypothetical protein
MFKHLTLHDLNLLCSERVIGHVMRELQEKPRFHELRRVLPEYFSNH